MVKYVDINKTVHIATISFGKDSTVMCDLLLKNDYPVDYILFTDTLLEFPIMYEYKKKVSKYFMDRYGIEVITLKPDTTFEEWCFGRIDCVDAKLNGYVRGVPMVWAEPCYWRREAKVKPQDKFIKSISNGKEVKIYIGFTIDESHRRMKGDEFLYPLIDDFKMTETNCQEYLINQEMENPLYKFFTRTGCGVCPAQSDRAWFNVYENFKDTWEYMRGIEQKLSKIEKVKNRTWFSGHRNINDMEKIFKQEKKQGSLFNFSDEPLRDCFCKI